MTTAVRMSELAKLIGAELLGPGDVIVDRIETLELAQPGALTFIRSHKFAKMWPQSKAAAAVISRDIPLSALVPDFDPGAPSFPKPLLVVHDVDNALIQAAGPFTPTARAWAPGVHPSAFVAPDAVIDPSVSVGPGCTVMNGAKLGPDVVLVGNVFIGAGAKLGRGCLIHPGAVVLERCVLGDHCIIHANTSIGADGFGYRPGPDGRSLVKIPHIGNVVIGNHVEIGANSCVDRAKFGSTTIGDGTKLDNLVQVGHGCHIGRCCVICGQSGLSGSVILGDGVMIGGGVGIADNVEVGAGARIAAFSGVTGHVPAGATYMGAPAGPVSEWRRSYAALRRMGKRSTKEEGC
ncbi:MAG: UDP-3-O-(3-hydroxymyristoyl)glucosamine N-acyltransferase [Phycisphaerales bacterium]|jgi:UDP-3-O-[3-hydroxymyristoyl] glucosamine N-acyltransferase